MTIRNLASLAFFAATGSIALQLTAGGSTPVGVSLGSSTNPSIFGQPIVLTVSVSPPAATGSVTFYDGTTMLGIRLLAGGKAALTTSLLVSGARLVRAYYAGDSTYASATSAVLTQKVSTIPAEGFSPGNSYGSSYPNSFAVGDFNGDGKADLAISMRANSLSVFLGNGDGTFQAAKNTPSVLLDSMTVADFNGDGKDDLVGIYSNGNASLLLGNGDGTFQLPVNFYAGSSPASVAAGDFNGDGKADIVVTNFGDKTISVFLGNGNGTFQPRVNYPAGSAPNSIVVGDFNGDGKADLAMADFGDDTVSVFLGNGDGTFRPRISFAAGVSRPHSLVIGAFNGGSEIDLAVTGDVSGVSVLLGNGDGTFRANVSYTTGDESPQVLAVGDFNGDTRPDLALIQGSSVSVLFGVGGGTFLATPSQPAHTFGQSGSLVVAEFNGDGKADLALITENGVNIRLGGLGQSTTTILTSSPNPSIYKQSVLLTATVSPATATGNVTFVDDGSIVLGTSPLVNGQAVLTTTFTLALPAFLTATYNGDTTYISSTSPVLVGIVNPVPTTTTFTSSPNPSHLGESVTLVATVSYAEATGTVEFRDGMVSLGTRPLSGGVAILVTSALSTGPHALTAAYAGDVNHAGSTSTTLNQVVGSGTATTIMVSSSAQQVTFGQSVILIAKVSQGNGPASGSGSVTFYDGVAVLGAQGLADGQASLTTSLLSTGAHAIRAYYGGNADSTASASQPVTIVISSQPANILQAPATYAPFGTSGAEGDFNADGKTDLVVTTSTGISVFLGNGDGTFQPGASYAIGGSPSSVVVGDFNGDGKADLAVSGRGAVRALLGNGDGTFQTAVNYPTGGNLSPTIVLGDFNGDGKADIAINTPGVPVLLGNGDGTFRPAVEWVGDSYSGFTAVGDFNGDGKIDFAASSATGGSILLGNGDGTFVKAAALGGVVAVGDFNGDGKVDVVVLINYPRNTLSPQGGTNLTVNLGNGDGTFRPGVLLTSGAGSLTYAVGVGDFNGDGNVDLAVLSLSAGTVVEYLGHGDGTFTAGVSYSAGASPSLLVGEFNGDGRTDLAGIGNTGVRVFLGGLLPPSTTTLVSSLNPSVYRESITLTAAVSPATATGKVTFYDGTGALGSAALANGSAALSTNTLWPGDHALTAMFNGDSNFFSSSSPILTQTVLAPPTAVTLTVSANPVTLGQHLVLGATVSNSSATGQILFSDNQELIGAGWVSGGIVASTMLWAPPSVGSHALTASYGGDQLDAPSTSPILTLVVIQGTPAGLVLTSSGNPERFGQSVTLTATASFQDVTGTVTFYDGALVLGAVPLKGGQASLTTSLLAAGTRSIRAYYAGDSSYAPGNTQVLSQVVSAVPASGFETPTSLALNQPAFSLVFGDFNGDGKADLVVGGSSNVSVLLGNGDGTFQPPKTIDAGCSGYSFLESYGVSVVLADFNGDGKTDLIASCGHNTASDRIDYAIFTVLGNGDGTFQPPVPYLNGYIIPQLTSVGDFNGDGITDILLGDTWTGDLNVLFGAGDGTFPWGVSNGLEILDNRLSNTSAALAVGDFNGDGIADIAVANSRLSNVDILLGDGNGFYLDGLTYSTGAGPISIASGDFNGDGMADLAVANVDGTVSVLLGAGRGRFQPAVSYRAGGSGAIGSPAIPLYEIGIAVGDFNGDGNLDLAVTNPLGVSVLLGNGDGTFQPRVLYAAGCSSIAVADINGDGRSDLVIGSISANGVSVLLGAHVNSQ